MNEMVKKMLKDSEKEYERIVNASYALKKGEICASCGAEWEDCKIPVPDESIW